ncbi:hypothetical protein [Paenibacillus sp. FSL L8-0708]|uniref:hypothetical protein n=1 Tax=Paenibacillus sp. FSL L8-0708 TaxID=2975311 RepID=UPI0030F53C87
MEKHKIQVPWDISVDLIKLLSAAIVSSEGIKALVEVSVITPSANYFVSIDTSRTDIKHADFVPR